MTYRSYATNGPLVSHFVRPAFTSGSSLTIRSRARSADAYISSGGTGRPYRPMSGSSLYYRMTTFYLLIPLLRSLRVHLVYPTLLLTHSSRTCLITYSYSWTSGPSRRFHARPQVFTAGSSSHPRSQATGGPVIDISALNRFLHSPHFWMETSTSIMRALQPGHWATSLDFKDAFFHIPVAPAHQLPVRPPLLPVPGPSVRSGNVTVPLHLPSQGSRGFCQEPGPFLTPLSGTTGTSRPPQSQPAWPGPRGSSLSPSESA